jgi:importin-5
MRSFAAVLFRRTASKSKKSPSGESKEMFLLLNSDARNVIRSKLLECLATEQINHVRNKISDAIAEIARQYTDNGMQTLGLAKRLLTTVTGDSWIELLSALLQASQSGDPGMRECAFRIFAATPGIIEKQHENAVQEVFGKGFKDSSVDVRANSTLQVLDAEFVFLQSRHSHLSSIPSPKRHSQSTIR